VPATSLRGVRGFVFDLDGCVWQGNTLNAGAADTLAALDASGRGVVFLTNNSRATAATVRARLHGLGLTFAVHCLTPLEIIGSVIRERFGISRVLVMGAPEMAAMIAAAGHDVLEMKDYRSASVVAVGNDFDLSYDRLAAAARAAAAGAPVVTPNLDPRLPIEDGDFLPGCGAIVQAVCATAGVKPIVIGKPEAPLFRMALDRLGVAAADSAMVGDSREADIAGARAVGMRTVLYAPAGADEADADVVVRSFAELARLV
jgi:HAD superfamily hydrolase (TIGR01450 family)